MNNRHISFDKLSAFHDNAILSNYEREEILNHIKSCNDCGKEYERLKMMITLVGGLNRFEIKYQDNLAGRTLELIKAQSRGKTKTLTQRHGFLMPAAAAASVILLLLLYFYTPFFEKYNNEEPIKIEKVYHSSASHDDYNNFYSSYEAAGTLSILRNYNVKILNISDTYIEGEINPHNYIGFKREFDDASVQHAAGNIKSENMEVGSYTDEFPPYNDEIYIDHFSEKHPIKIKIMFR